MNSEKLLLCEKEAAELLSMSTHFLRRDRISDRSAGIPFIRVGGSVRYRRVDLETWIIEQTNVKRLQVPKRDGQELQSSEKRSRGRPRKTKADF